METEQTLKPSGTTTKIVGMKLSDQVFVRLREVIANGELAAGDSVPSERVLMDRFGVAPAVRETHQALRNMGVITCTQPSACPDCDIGLPSA